VLLSLAAVLVPDANAAEPTGWALWLAGLAKSCPARHVDWVGDGGYDELIGAFAATLPKPVEAKITALADYEHRCASEKAGFSCEMGVHLDAYRRLHLMRAFVLYGCRNVRCEEAALCSQFPHSSQK
jgi:hypothetical protein